MKKSRLFLIFSLLLFTMFNILYINTSKATSTSTLSTRAREAAIRIGPERMMKFGFDQKEHLGNVNYRNQKEVSAVQKHLVDLYPDRPDLYKRAACALGECLRESGKYTEKEVERVVWYITKLTDQYYGKK